MNRLTRAFWECMESQGLTLAVSIKFIILIILGWGLWLSKETNLSIKVCKFNMQTCWQQNTSPNKRIKITKSSKSWTSSIQRQTVPKQSMRCQQNPWVKCVWTTSLFQSTRSKSQMNIFKEKPKPISQKVTISSTKQVDSSLCDHLCSSTREHSQLEW